MRAPVFALLIVGTLLGCGSAEPRQPQPPRHKTWEDEGADPWDHPENTTPRAASSAPRRSTSSAPGDEPARPPAPARANVKVELSVVDVISWDEVKIRGGIRGSCVRGVVSLTGWLVGGKSKGGSKTTTSQFIVVAPGSQGSIEVSDPSVRALCGDSWSLLRVAVIQAAETGEIDLAIDPLVSPTEEGRLTLATRVRVSAGEALVVGGKKTDAEDEEPGAARREKRDQLVILTATLAK
jgi:hypothetical protein